MSVFQRMKSVVSVCEVEKLRAEIAELKEEHNNELTATGKRHQAELQEAKDEAEAAKQFAQNLLNDLKKTTDEMEKILESMEALTNG